VLGFQRSNTIISRVSLTLTFLKAITYLFRLFRVGGAVFIDVGRTWGENPVGSENLGWLRNLGFGLRLGNTRSGAGRVLHVDLAFPLDGAESISRVQLLLQAKKSF